MPERNEVLAVLKRRSAIRKYTEAPVSPEDLSEILQCGQRAPTDASAQLYSVIRIVDRNRRDRIAHLCGDQRHVAEAAEFFVICADIHRTDRLLAHRGLQFGMLPRASLLFGIVDASLVAENMVIAAVALGYGTCFIGGVQNRSDELAELIGLPPGVIPLFGLCIGVPAEAPPRSPRIPLDAAFMEDGYRELSETELEACYRAMAPASSRGDWKFTLERYFAVGGTMARREAVIGRMLRRQGFEPFPTTPTG